MTTPNTELAWAAGFFDAEGCTSTIHTHKGKYKHTAMSIVQTTVDPNDIPQELTRFNSATNNVGQLYLDDHRRTPNHNVKYSLQYHKRSSVSEVISCIWPYLDIVKRLQFLRSYNETLLERYNPIDFVYANRDKETELAWCAGFFDGDGHVRVDNKSSGNGLSFSLSVAQTTIAIDNYDIPTSLIRLRDALGLGVIRYTRKLSLKNKKPVYTYHVYKVKDILSIYAMIGKYLCDIKRDQFQNVSVFAKQVTRSSMNVNDVYFSCGHKIIAINIQTRNDTRSGIRCRLCVKLNNAIHYRQDVFSSSWDSVMAKHPELREAIVA